MEYQRQELPKYCRACFSCKSRNLFDIFQNEIEKLYFEFSGLPISEGDSYSKYICLSCVDELNHWQDFKEKLIESRSRYFVEIISPNQAIKSEKDENELVSIIEIHPETLQKHVVENSGTNESEDINMEEDTCNHTEDSVAHDRMKNSKIVLKKLNQTEHSITPEVMKNPRVVLKDLVFLATSAKTLPKESLEKLQNFQKQRIFKKTLVENRKNQTARDEIISKKSSPNPDSSTVTSEKESTVPKTPNKMSVTPHQQADDAEKIFKCNLQHCPYATDKNRNILIHYYSHKKKATQELEAQQTKKSGNISESITRTCNYENCSFSTDSLISFIDHSLVHELKQRKTPELSVEEPKSWKCNLISCPYTTDKVFKLNCHYRAHRQNAQRKKTLAKKGKPFECQYPDCKFSTISLVIFIDHSLDHEKKQELNTIDVGTSAADPNTNIYRCQLEGCLYATKTVKNIRGHYYNHKKSSNNDIKTVKLCNEGLKGVSEIYLSSLSKIKETSKTQYICNFENCLFATNNYRSFRDHLSKHVILASNELKKKLACNVCGKSFYEEKLMQKHKKSHIEFQSLILSKMNVSKACKKELSNKFACSECDMKFPFENLLKTHMKIHLQKESSNFVCTLCGKIFKTAPEMKIHCLTHYKESGFCTICKITYKDKKALKYHESKHHPELDIIHECKECGKKFSNFHTFNTHSRVHATGPFECDFCGLKFIYKMELTKHLKTHQQRKKQSNLMTCELCAINFTAKSDYSRHLREHNKPTCSICGDVFRSNVTLLSHMDKHEREASTSQTVKKKYKSFQNDLI